LDTALENGDFRYGSNGRPIRIAGEQELLQRAMIRLNVPLGSFDYDATLGSRLHTLKADDTDFNEKAVSMAQEALRQLAEVTVSGVRRPADKPGTVAVQLSYNGKTAEIEVKL
jgi:phage gp46-like protein